MFHQAMSGLYIGSCPDRIIISYSDGPSELAIIYPEKITHLISSSQTYVPQFSWIPWYPPVISHLSKPWKISHFKMMLRCWDHDLDSWIPLVFLLTCTYHHSKWHRKKPTASISGHPTASVLRQDWFVVLQRVGFRRKSIEITPKYEE